MTESTEIFHSLTMLTADLKNRECFSRIDRFLMLIELRAPLSNSLLSGLIARGVFRNQLCCFDR